MIYTIKEPANHCVAHAVSILRSSLGYEVEIEDVIDPNDLMELQNLFAFIPILFYNHKCTLFVSKSCYSLAKDSTTIEVLHMEDYNQDEFYGNYAYLFDYFTAGNSMSHCVIGFPILLPGTDSQFVLRIDLNV